jgi:tryptophanyl-tRNA synthetase
MNSPSSPSNLSSEAINEAPTLTPTAAPKRPVIFSAMQPSSELTLGNYIGALRNWVALQETHDCVYCVVDQHAITIHPDAAALRKQTLDVAAMYVASGINPNESVVFVQSHVPAHAQLAWVLGAFAQMGELNKMTQFKEKSDKHGANSGLFTYPVLQAADILLYQANCVPVGEDQKQHLELARNVAERFNHHYSETFAVPEPYITTVGARVMSLQDPTKKMSKSDENRTATIFLTDSSDEIQRKIKRAVTDSGSEIRHSNERPAISNLIELYHVATGESIHAVEKQFDGKGYGVFKESVAEAIVEMLRPIQERYTQIRGDKTALNTLLKHGAERASHLAHRTLRKVYKKVGFVEIE